MADTFTYKCQHCEADIQVSEDPIPETVTCEVCGKETTIVRDAFYSGEAFSGEF